MKFKQIALSVLAVITFGVFSSGKLFAAAPAAALAEEVVSGDDELTQTRQKLAGQERILAAQVKNINACLQAINEFKQGVARYVEQDSALKRSGEKGLEYKNMKRMEAFSGGLNAAARSILDLTKHLEILELQQTEQSGRAVIASDFASGLLSRNREFLASLRERITVLRKKVEEVEDRINSNWESIDQASKRLASLKDGLSVLEGDARVRSEQVIQQKEYVISSLKEERDGLIRKKGLYLREISGLENMRASISPKPLP